MSTPSLPPEKSINLSRVFCAYIKNNSDGNRIFYYGIQLQPTVSDQYKVNTFSFGFIDEGVPMSTVAALAPVQYADGVTDVQLSNQASIEWQTFPTESFSLDANGYIVLAAPQSVDGVIPIRTYLFTWNLGSISGELWKRILGVWDNTPLHILAGYDPASAIKPDGNLLSVEVDITDCDSVMDSIASTVDAAVTNLSSIFGSNPLFTDADKDYIKGLIKSDPALLASDPSAGQCYQGIVNTLPEQPNETVEPYKTTQMEDKLSDIDKLICYLQGKILHYKSQVVVVSGSGMCYGFINCLVKAIVNLKCALNAVEKAYRDLSLAYSGIVARWNKLALICKEVEAAEDSLISSTTTWIQSNVDPSFDVSKVSCTQLPAGSLKYKSHSLY